jgi:hypothetical protein
MIFANDLLHIFITLERDVTDQFSIKIDESLAGSCLAAFDVTSDRTGDTFDTSFFWLRDRPDGLLWTHHGAGITINTDIRDRSLFLLFDKRDGS